MKQKIKQTLMAIVGLFLSTTAFSHDFEVNGIYYNYLDKTAKTVEVTYKGSSYNDYSNEYTGAVTIPSSVTYNSTTYSVTKIGFGAFEFCSYLTSVSIGNSVTTIGVQAFYNCSGLTSVTIPNSVTTIGSNAFYSTPWYNNKPDGVVYINNVLYKYKGTMPVGTSIDIKEGTISISDNAFFDCSGLTSVTIPNSVTSIGGSAFSSCTSLTEVNISDLSAWCKIDFGGYSANPLYYAKKLKLNGTEIKDLVIPNDITEIKDYAFNKCTGLTSVIIPNSVTSIGNYAFEDCTGFTELIIEDGKETLSLGHNYYNSSYTGEGLFYDCPLEKLYLGRNLNYESDRRYGYSPFYSKTKLKEVTIGKSVTLIGGYAFSDCSGLTSVTIPNSVTSIGGYAFSDCSGLTSVTIGSGISSIPSGAFSVKPLKTIWLTNTPPSGYSNVAGTINYVANDQYSSLSNVKVYPYLSSMFEVDGVKYVPVSPSERTCDAIDCTYNPTDTIINIGNTVTFKGVAMTVKEINPYICYGNSHIKECKIDYNGNIHNYAFYGCSAIKNATINAEAIGKSAFQNSATINPATFSIDTKSISDYAFYGCSAIETITLREGLGKIDNSAFSGCSKLKEVVIPNSATLLGESAFYGCSSITSATIGNAVENINASTFYNCKSLENIIIGNEVKSIGKNSFYGCSALPIIEIPKNVTSIGDYAFDNCSNLSDVIIEDRDSALTLGSNGSSPMFSDCSLDSVYIGGDISYKTTSSYGYSPFYNNKTLRAVTITDKETEISDNEFYGCANLKSVSIGDGVETIGKYAFSGCASLESFAFGSSMKTIGEEAFSDCTALVKLRSKAMTPPVCGTQALDDINKWNCELYVPEVSISAYQAADQWKEFFFMYVGVEGVKIDCNAIEVSRYDIHGRLLSEPARGINIVKMSDGTTRKEIIK